MPTIRQLIPTINPPDEPTKVQVLISLRNKRRILSSCADDGIFTLIIANAFQRTADFIDQHEITSYDPTKLELLLNFIQHGTDPRTTGSVPVADDARATKSVQHKDATASRKSVSTRVSDAKRIRREAREGAKD